MRFLVGVMIGFAAFTPVAAQEATTFDVKAAINRLAFDPARYFADQRGEDLLRITYRGDDYDFPVWSLTIRNGCLPGQPRPSFFKGRVARMVRAPVPEIGAERPRWRGMALVNALGDARSEGEVTDRLDKAGLEWVEADMATCPGGMDALKAIADARWPSASRLLPSDEMEPIVLHADKMTVEVPAFLHHVRFSGAIFPGNPGEAAVKLARALDPCWKPTNAPVPWRNPAPLP